jgi:DNA-binding XRE family transcriptional regulator
MGRLIDADVLLEAMRKTEEAYENESMRPSWWTAYNVVKAQPTAYDVEAVVAELEKDAFERFGNDGMGGQKVVALDDAISIVRGKE